MACVVCVYVARGVGTAKIIGRVHIAQMRFGNSVFPVSITVLEKNDVDFLFGLDTLRRYRCVIDLG
jgi:DNA damage-inducible protein 1